MAKKEGENKFVPNIYGFEANYIKLTSYDSQHYFIKRDIAEQSNTIKQILSSAHSCTPNDKLEIRLTDIDSKTLGVICRYLTYKMVYDHTTSSSVPDFEFSDDLSFSVLHAANFLDI
uniref:Elongin-C n=2 Tax=Strongyloides TaxID=6247 RepID=A0A0K0FLI3_STRVS